MSEWWSSASFAGGRSQTGHGWREPRWGCILGARVVRHPMYAGLLFATWGVLILKSSWAGSVLAVVATACVLRAMRAEESENLRYFGSTYEAYMSRSKRFVPWVI